MATMTKGKFTDQEKQLVAALGKINEKTNAELQRLAQGPSFVQNAVKAIRNTLYAEQASVARTLPEPELDAFMDRLGLLLERYELWRADLYRKEGSLLEEAVDDRFQKSKGFSDLEKEAINAYREAGRLARMERTMSAWLKSSAAAPAALRKG